MDAERRQYVRVVSRLIAFVKVRQTGKVLRGLTRDLSAVGLCVTLEGWLGARTPLEVELQLPDRSQPVRFTAEVVWCRRAEGKRLSTPADVGIKFVVIDPKDRAAIMHYAMLNALPPS